MKETSFVEGSKYAHQEGLTYFMFGLASRIEKRIENAQVIGLALGVAGYEETGEVKGDPIAVYKTDNGYNFMPVGQFDCPEQAVVYMQLEDGEKYRASQLWWRPVENFQEHFNLIENPVSL